MKQIKLTQGQFALVDNEDFEFLNQCKWQYQKSKNTNTGYARGVWKLHQHGTYMHRLIMGLEFGNKKQIDHIDSNGLNNQKSNLRICTLSENLRNRKPAINGTSKYLGVSKLCNQGRFYWSAQITHNKKCIKLGRFPYNKEGEIKAAKKYNEAAKKYNGEFARLNKL